MKAILYTSTRCPNCPPFRRLMRQVAADLGLIEGKHFVEKIIDGESLEPGNSIILDGEEIHIVDSQANIEKTPAAIGGQDFLIEALQHQVASTPALVIDGEPAFVGELPTREELIARLREKI